MSNYDSKSNPYLKLGFWEFLALSTVMILFFPWSVFICLALYGVEETKLIILALIEDFIKEALEAQDGNTITITPGLDEINVAIFEHNSRTSKQCINRDISTGSVETNSSEHED